MDANALRAETLRRFASWDLAANEHLPLIEADDELRPQSAPAAAKRAVAASYIVGLCYGADFPTTQRHLETFGLWESLAQGERALFEKGSLSEHNKAPSAG
jgi:predicted transcriptional regulator